METIGEVVHALERWVPALLPDADRARRIVQVCREATDLSAVVSVTEIAKLHAAVHPVSRHLNLFFDTDTGQAPDTISRGWPPADVAEIRQRKAFVSATRLVGEIAVIRIDGLDPVEHARPFIEAALAAALDARGLIVDLRNNGGGDPATVALIAGAVLGPLPFLLSDVHADTITHWTSTPPAERLCVPATTKVALLISEVTFSSGEALAYHLQARGRVRIFGSKTPGAADHVTPIQLTSHVSAHLPRAWVIDSVTGTNWEGVGVTPDAQCVSSDAELLAIEWLSAAAGYRSET